MFKQKFNTRVFFIALTLSLGSQQAMATELVQAPVNNNKVSSETPEQGELSQACKILGLCI